VEEDSSKQGRSLIEEFDMDADISLVPPHVEIQEKASGETEEQEVSTVDIALNIASIPFSIASATLEVSTAAANLVYIRRSAEKWKDKGKAIMIEDESVQKKSKKQLEQERLSHEEAIRLQEQIDEEARKRIARDAKIAKQLQEEYDKAGKKEAVTEVDTAHVIDWNDPFIIRAGEDAETEPAKRQRTKEVSESVQEQTNEEPKTNELSQEQLNQMIIIVLDEVINVEALQTKYPIIRWEVHSDDNILVQERYNSSGLTEDKEIELWVELKISSCIYKDMTRYIHAGGKGLSTDKWTCNFDAMPKLSTDSNKSESMKLEAMVEERRIFNCWFHYHTTNGHKFTMSNRPQKLASPEQTTFGKEISNPFMAGSLPKTTWPT
ncbi:hypothetical protein Tco_1065581, partial [Tanacetum coccineum]